MKTRFNIPWIDQSLGSLEQGAVHGGARRDCAAGMLHAIGGRKIGEMRPAYAAYALQKCRLQRWLDDLSRDGAPGIAIKFRQMWSAAGRATFRIADTKCIRRTTVQVLHQIKPGPPFLSRAISPVGLQFAVLRQAMDLQGTMNTKRR